MNSKIYPISAALLLLCSPYALAVDPSPPKVTMRLEPGGLAGRVMVRWTQNATDVEWYAVERLGSSNLGVITWFPKWREVGRVKAREGLGGRDLEVVHIIHSSEAPTPSKPAQYRVCTVRALQRGEWSPAPDSGFSSVPGKKCSQATLYPLVKQEVDQVRAPSLTPQGSSTLRTGPALKTAPSGSASTSTSSQASPPTVADKLKPGDAQGSNPLPTPPGTAKINGGGVLQSQPAPRPSRHICDAARDARARNSPAAPNLEAQCRATGGKP